MNSKKISTAVKALLVTIFASSPIGIYYYYYYTSDLNQISMQHLENQPDPLVQFKVKESLDNQVHCLFLVDSTPTNMQKTMLNKIKETVETRLGEKSPFVHYQILSRSQESDFILHPEKTGMAVLDFFGRTVYQVPFEQIDPELSVNMLSKLVFDLQLDLYLRKHNFMGKKRPPQNS